MNKLTGFFSAITQVFRKLVGLVLPIFKNASDFRNWPAAVRIIIGLALLVTFCFAAYMLQQVFKLERLLLHVNNEFVRKYYLVILFLLMVAFSWLAFIFWKLLAQEQDAAEFPDIAEAWSEAVSRLQADGMMLEDAPLFLVLGRPAAGMDAFFLAAGVKDIIRTPSGGEPPLRIYAWKDAIYVTATGCSAWGALSGELTGQGEANWVGDLQPESAAAKTIGAGGFAEGMHPASRARMDQLMQEAKVRELSQLEQNELRQLADEMAGASSTVQKKISMPEEVQVRGTRRLRFLCKLIANERRPWCPVNGLVVLVPWEATESEESSRISSNVLQRDLIAAREVFKLRYPTYSIVCDLETARGFEEFRSGFPAETLKQRIGQRLPLVPDVDPDKVPVLIGQAANWIGLSVLPAWILRFLRLDQDPRNTNASKMHNRNLYLLMSGVFDRGPRLAQVLARGVPAVGGDDPISYVPFFGGCYLAATGKDGKGQAFVPGVFERIQSTVDKVSWTPEAQRADSKLKRLTILGYLVILIIALAAVAAGWYAYEGK